MKGYIINKALTIFISVFAMGAHHLFANNTVTINQAGAQVDPTNSSSILFTVQFNEAVTGFDGSDLNFTGSTASGTLVGAVTEIAPNDGTRYRVTVTGMTGNGLVVVSVNAGAATLVSDGTTTTAASTSTDNQVTYDGAAPTATLYSPADNATGVTLNTNLDITFNEDIIKGSGTIELRRYADDGLVESFVLPAAAQVTIIGGGSQARINPSSNLLSSTQYYVIIPSTAFVDAAGNTFAGLSTKDDWDFTTVNTPPSISALNPADGATGVSINLSQVVITFDEAVVNVGTGANANNTIRIRDVAAAADIETIDPTSPGRVTISGGGNNIATISLTVALSPNKNYAVRIGNAVFQDTGGAAFAGTDDNTTWNFQSEAAPVISGYSSSPTCIGESIVINGTGFGASVPSVTVNGVSATVTAHTSTTITITVPATTTGTVSVTNNSNSLSGTGASLTVNPAINTSLNTFALPPSSFVGSSTSIRLDNSQNGVTYQLRKNSPAPAGNVGASQPGNGAQLSFPSGTYATPGTYVYEIRATSPGCTNATLTNTISVNVSSLSANAGNPATICAGQSHTLGGNPTAQGGSGFYQVTWNTVPPTGNFSTSTNPSVSPATTTTYRVTVDDNSGNPPVTSDVTITVNTPEPAGNLAIVLTPSNPTNTYQTDDAPVQLKYTISGIDGTYSGATRFEGTGVNAAARLFYPQAANLGLNIITLYYQNPAGCITSITKDVVVTNPGLFISGLDYTYCEESITDNLVISDPEFLPTATYIYGYRYTYQNDIRLYDYLTNQEIPEGSPGFDVNNFNNRLMTINPFYFGTYYKYFVATYQYQQLLYNPLAPATPTVLYTYSFPINIYFEVVPKPNILSKIPLQFCENDGAVELIVDPPPIVAGDISKFKIDNTSNGLSSSGGKVFFNPGTGGLPNSVSIKYTYTDTQSGCSSDYTQVSTIRRIPTIDFSFVNACEGDTVQFIPTISDPAQTKQYAFSFGDGKSEEVLSGTPKDIFHQYLDPQSYQVKLGALFTNGCADTIPKNLLVGKNPKFRYGWANVCEGQTTQFTAALEGNFNAPEVQSMNWNFGEGLPFNTGSFSATAQHVYTAPGKYNSSLSITSSTGCTIQKTREVYNVKHYKNGNKITGNNPYIQNFDASADSWISSGINSSWQWDVPQGAIINRDSSDTGTGKAWITNATGTYNSNEHSWVHSPCFDLTELERPVLRMDLRVLTDLKRDGAVLQVNTTNNTEGDIGWQTIGGPQQGIDWYNTLGIEGAPGGQALVGWSGFLDPNSWRTALIPLDDDLPPLGSAQRNAVRFRVAFGTQLNVLADASLEGFAFDNFSIDQRNRIVLLEQFTNNGGPNTPAEANKASNAAVNQFIGLPKTTNEIVKLEYHLGFPGPAPDPLFHNNEADANSRAAFYGITSTPSVRMDAEFENSAFSSWGEKRFDQQSLFTSKISIDTIITANTPAEKFNVEVRFTVLQDIPANTVLHIAVVEKNITSVTGANGETVFTQVMKKMLPDAAGTKYTNPLPKNFTDAVQYSWSPNAYDLNQLAVIAFFQNENTKEIYQTKFLSTPSYIPPATIITGVEPSILDQVRVYPNPANQEVRVSLTQKTPETIDLNMTDAIGRSVHRTTFVPGVVEKSIPTGDLPSGVYFIQLRNREGKNVIRKLVVVHN
ncbi:MAG: Ig-like domain-containing protein [Cyclobacteriaceae bacterium]|nr:Ig-like domain-containing protein [Cyclobacteriaceae bacterium]